MTFDVSGLPRRVVERMTQIERARFRANMAAGVANQRRIAKRHHDRPPRPVADCAEMTMALDPRLDGVMRANYGTDVQDPAFRDWFTRRDEHGQMARVRTRSGKIRIQNVKFKMQNADPGPDGFVRVNAGRWRKVYG
ncbi:MAG: hypothetical protein HW378_187 [Anaerolineales bacterium]|nr:hypothetical protein [Anaerolineales bacterium]